MQQTTAAHRLLSKARRLPRPGRGHALARGGLLAAVCLAGAWALGGCSEPDASVRVFPDVTVRDVRDAYVASLEDDVHTSVVNHRFDPDTGLPPGPKWTDDACNTEWTYRIAISPVKEFHREQARVYQGADGKVRLAVRHEMRRNTLARLLVGSGPSWFSRSKNREQNRLRETAEKLRQMAATGPASRPAVSVDKPAEPGRRSGV